MNAEIAEELFKEAFKGQKTKRLNQDSLCEMCVRNRCRVITLARRLNTDNKPINDLLKHIPKDNEESFWMGKNTTRNWRKYARKNLDDKLQKEAIEFAESDHETGKLSLAEVQSKLSKVGKFWIF